MQFNIINAHIITETHTISNGWLTVADGQIVAFGASPPPPTTSATVIDAGGKILTAGFLDIHVHGGNGHEVMDATPEAVIELSRFYARHGVTGFLATTWTADDEPIYRALAQVAETRVDGAYLWGAHVEGPYVNPNKAGAQNPHLIRRANMTEFARWQSTGVIRLMTIAPEFAENLAMIDHCTANHIVTSAGHTDATLADMRRAIEHGLTNTTHTFNAMRPLHHREAGTVGAALLFSELRCEVICDGVHVQPDVVRLLYQTKGADGVILITDAVRGAGLPRGTEYQQDGRRVTVRESAYLDDGTLAGSTLTMDVAVQNFVRFTGQSFDEIWRCTSFNAARALKIDDQTGSIAVGKRADLVLLDEALNVVMTMVGGKVVYGG